MPVSAAVTALVGPSVVDKSGSPREIDLPDDGVLGLYFSAHWCPPCRGFTPKLAEFYNRFKSTEAGKRLEIVFVSSDRDEESFKEYHNEMPWPALGFNDRERKAALSKKFKVSGIPTLVFVQSESGKLITDSGRDCITEDPDGKDFPWIPKPLSELLSSGKLLSGSGEVEAEEALKGKVKGLYFSAHWCPPCRGFTPKLAETYKKMKEAQKNFEIIFATSDNDEESFKEYFSEMPWLAFPFEDSRISQLSNRFGISGIPSLILLDENNDVISKKGRAVISDDPNGEKFPWPEQPFAELTQGNAGELYEAPALVLLTDGQPDLISQAVSLLGTIAPDYQAEVRATRDSDQPAPALLFFYEGPKPAEEQKVLHYGVTCDGCRGEVRGIRYKCTECDDYDLCEKCKADNKHPEHELNAITEPLRPPPPPMMERLRQIVATKPETRLRLFILNIPETQKYVMSYGPDGSDPVTEAVLRGLVADYKTGSLEFESLQGEDDD